MKEFIVAVIALALLIAFPIQGLVDAAIHSREQVFDATVRSYAEKARLEGRFTKDLIDAMTEELCDKLPGLTPEDLRMEATMTEQYRTAEYDEAGLIHYAVTMRIHDRFVGGLIFGSIDDSNMAYTCSGSVASELLP